MSIRTKEPTLKEKEDSYQSPAVARVDLVSGEVAQVDLHREAVLPLQGEDGENGGEIKIAKDRSRGRSANRSILGREEVDWRLFRDLCQSSHPDTWASSHCRYWRLFYNSRLCQAANNCSAACLWSRETRSDG